MGALLALLAAGAVRVADLLVSTARITPDTFDYARQSRLPLFSAAFWGSQHPPLLPFLWKLSPGLVASADPVQLRSLAPVLVLNVVVGVGCWSFLAVTVARALSGRALQAVAFVAVLALSVAPEVAGWDSAAVSESLSISLAALLVALVLRYVDAPTTRMAVALAAVVVLFGLLRDTSIPLAALALGPVLLVTRRRNAGVVVAALLAVTAVSLWGQSAGHRSSIPTRNAIAFAIAADGAGPWFEARGLPVGPDTPRILVERPASAFDTNPRAARLRPWLAAKGRSTWLAYLATHPSRTTRLAENLSIVYDPPRAALANYWGVGGIERGFFPRSSLLVLLAALGAAGATVARRRKDTLVLGSMLLACAVTSVLMWDADAVEFYRHAVVVPVLTRVALIALALGGLDCLLEEVAQRRRSSTWRSRLAFDHQST
jgi:hypothetical protein